MGVSHYKSFGVIAHQKITLIGEFSHVGNRKMEDVGMDSMSLFVEGIGKRMDDEARKNILSHFPQFDTNPKGINVLNDIYRMIDKLTILLLCNTHEEETVKKQTESLGGFWEIIGVPYVERGQVVLIKREDLKMVLLSANRKNKKNGTDSPPNCGTI